MKTTRTRSLRATAPTKTITDFVAKVTKEGSPDFGPPAERIALLMSDVKGARAGGEKTLVEIVAVSHRAAREFTTESDLKHTACHP